MNFQIHGKLYPITPEDVLAATRDVEPNAVDGRHKYFVTLHGRQYPVKQVLQLVTGLAPLVFTSQYALSILPRLGFEISERPDLKVYSAPVPAREAGVHAAEPSPEATVDLDAPAGGQEVLNLLVVFERDEDGWEVASCPTLPGCHSQGRTRAEALANIREPFAVTWQACASTGNRCLPRPSFRSWRSRCSGASSPHLGRRVCQGRGPDRL